MGIENIKKLMALKKEAFFDNSKDGLLKKIIKEQSDFIISLTDFLSITLIPTILSCLFGLMAFYFLKNELQSLLIGVLSLPFFGSIMSISMNRRNGKFIRRQIEKNGDFKKEFFDSYILPYFLKQKIDCEMIDTLKINLSLDQYKALKLQSSSDINYDDVCKFIENIENTNQILKEIEAEKYSVEYENIKKEIQLA